MKMKTKRGFTLIEMLVVMGIIAVLIGASVGGYSAFIKKAQQARGYELVSNVATALGVALQNNDGTWPRGIASGYSGSYGEIDATVGAALARKGGLSLNYEQKVVNGESRYQLTGNDRLGVLSPWGQAVVRKQGKSASDSTRVPSGGTIKDHRLRYALDDDYDGIVKNVPRCGKTSGTASVRASACVWCSGYDGVFGTKDDIFSWTSGQEED